MTPDTSYQTSDRLLRLKARLSAWLGAISDYAAWRPWFARLVLLTLTLLIAYGLLLDIDFVRDATTKTDGEHGDIALYRAVVDRLQAGESFYPANGDEQHQRGYPTTPFLTWRLPTEAWIISLLGDEWAANLQRLLAMLAVLIWIKPLRESRLGRVETVCGALLASSSLMIMFAESALYLHEAWAATLIALSLSLWSLEWRLSVVFGLAALAFRELALPYALVMAVCALWDGRGREALWWMFGLLAFAIGLALHAWIISGYVGPEAREGGGWLAFGGWTFLLTANKLNGLIIMSGTWLAAIWVPLAILGAGAWRDGVGRRLFLIVAGYSLAFLFVGRPNNGYWGIVYSPLMAVSLIFAPRALWALWSASRVDWRSMPHIQDGKK